ncbi:hypothetical protein [Halorhabdus sp. CUG00001]|uniref:DUF7109 family protein n=1 Tax=Halorhabdus sp. CUG00001 TaxID=2600297 RepID=UPI00131C6D04|nr:hypothetical protein [Halorhabdus sp. CUG00001]
MNLSADEIAGVVDLFGALPRATLRTALSELAFKRGIASDPDEFEAAIADAIDSYHLLELSDESTQTPLVVVGPTAFPKLPDGASDLPHILDIDDRSIDRDRLGAAAEQRFRADASRAVEAGTDHRVRELLDVSYELDAWGPVDLETTRDRLDAALEGTDGA